MLFAKYKYSNTKSEMGFNAHHDEDLDAKLLLPVHSFYFELYLIISYSGSGFFLKFVSCNLFSVSDDGIFHLFKGPSVKYYYTQIRGTPDYDYRETFWIVIRQKIGGMDAKTVICGYITNSIVCASTSKLVILSVLLGICCISFSVKDMF